MTNIYIPCCFIAFDIVTGLLKAMHNGNISSSVLREGLFNKMAEILALIGSYGLEIACVYMEFPFDVPVCGAVAIYICLMELISCIENLCAVNSSLCKLFEPYLAKMKSGKE